MRLFDVAPKPSPDTATTPSDFDAQQFPVLALHWFGIAPPRPWHPFDVVPARAVGRLPVVDEPGVEVA